MDDAERKKMREEITAELAPLLEERLASREWGRALVTMIPRENGSFRVASIDVEDVVGNEKLIDRAMGSAEMRELLPVLERATQALVATFEVEMSAVEGGTFLRREDGSLDFLPGLVHAPSESFGRETEGALAFLSETRANLAKLISGATRFDVDLDAGELRFLRGDELVARASAFVVGSFAREARTFTWAWQNPSLAEAVRKASRDACDAVSFRDMWELTTANLPAMRAPFGRCHRSWGRPFPRSLCRTFSARMASSCSRFARSSASKRDQLTKRDTRGGPCQRVSAD